MNVTNTSEIVRWVAFYLLEGDDDVDYHAKIFADRMILRVFNAPALMSYLRGIAVLDSKTEGVKDGEHVFQLKFSKLPDEIIPQVKQLLSVPNLRVVEFEDHHVTCTGFEFSIPSEELDFSKDRDVNRNRPNQVSG